MIDLMEVENYVNVLKEQNSRMEAEYDTLRDKEELVTWWSQNWNLYAAEEINPWSYKQFLVRLDAKKFKVKRYPKGKDWEFTSVDEAVRFYNEL